MKKILFSILLMFSLFLIIGMNNVRVFASTNEDDEEIITYTVTFECEGGIYDNTYT